MLPFVELDASRVRLAPGQALLRARDYQDYLSANRLVEAARERAAEIEREAHEVYQEQKRLGWEAGLEEARLRQAGLIQETLLRCNRYYRQVDRQLGEVVLQAVRKVLRHYDAVELTLAATREALALVSNQKQVILHVQPNNWPRCASRSPGCSGFPRGGLPGSGRRCPVGPGRLHPGNRDRDHRRFARQPVGGVAGRIDGERGAERRGGRGRRLREPGAAPGPGVGSGPRAETLPFARGGDAGGAVGAFRAG